MTTTTTTETTCYHCGERSAKQCTATDACCTGCARACARQDQGARR